MELGLGLRPLVPYVAPGASAPHTSAPGLCSSGSAPCARHLLPGRDASSEQAAPASRALLKGLGGWVWPDVQEPPECAIGEALSQGLSFPICRVVLLMGTGIHFSWQQGLYLLQKSPPSCAFSPRHLHGKAAPSPGEPASPAVLEEGQHSAGVRAEKTRLQAASAE